MAFMTTKVTIYQVHDTIRTENGCILKRMCYIVFFKVTWPKSAGPCRFRDGAYMIWVSCKLLMSVEVGLVHCDMAECSVFARRPAPNNPFSSSLKDGILCPSLVCASKRQKKDLFFFKLGCTINVTLSNTLALSVGGLSRNTQEGTIHGYKGVSAFFRRAFSSLSPSVLGWVPPPPGANTSLGTGPQEVYLWKTDWHKHHVEHKKKLQTNSNQEYGPKNKVLQDASQMFFFLRLFVLFWCRDSIFVLLFQIKQLNMFCLNRTKHKQWMCIIHLIKNTLFLVLVQNIK